MAVWKFTDTYGAGYATLSNSKLGGLVFDVPAGSSAVNQEKFSASLDLTATGGAMKVFATLLGMHIIPMTGTVTTTGGILNVALQSDNDAAMLAALAGRIPLIGGSLMRSAALAVSSRIAASAAADEVAEADEVYIDLGINIGSHLLKLMMPAAPGGGTLVVAGVFQDVGIALADLDVLVPGTPFSTMFPTSLPATYYNPASTSLNLLSLQLMLDITTEPAFSISVSSVSASIGIANIALYSSALYLNPLAVNIRVSNPTTKPTPGWSLSGELCLYPYDKQSSPPAIPADLSYTLTAQLPSRDTPRFTLDGHLHNPADIAVAKILCDLMNDGRFDTGISNQLTVKTSDFSSQADTQSGSLEQFSVAIAMNAASSDGHYLGLFGTHFGIKDFSISVAHVK